MPGHRCRRMKVVAPGPGGGCERPTAGDTSSGDRPLWPPLLGTPHRGLGHFMAMNSGETSVWPPTPGRAHCGHHPGAPPGTCHHLQGQLIMATALGSPHCSHQPQGHGTVGTISTAISSKGLSPLWPPALGRPQHWGYQLLGHTTTDISAWGHCTMAMSPPQPPALGTPQYRCHTQGPLTRPGISRDMPPYPLLSPSPPPLLWDPVSP